MPEDGKISDHLANERTFLAWIRTSVGLMGFGFVVVKFSIFLKQISIDIDRTVPAYFAWILFRDGCWSRCLWCHHRDTFIFQIRKIEKQISHPVNTNHLEY